MNTVVKLRIIFLPFCMLLIGKTLKARDSKEHLRGLLKKNPAIAEQFLQKIAKKTNATHDSRQAITPEKLVPPVVHPKPTPTPKPVVQPEPKPTPEQKPSEKLWITEQERNDIHSILTILETYAARVLIGIESFFSKSNYQSIGTHAASLKAQLSYLQQNLIQKFPQAQTPKQQPLFKQLYELTKAMEKAQIVLFNTLNKKYSPSALGVLSLANEFNKISTPLDRLLKVTQQNSTLIKNELQKARVHDIATRVVKLQATLNKIFNYGKDSPARILAAVSHRLKQ